MEVEMKVKREEIFFPENEAVVKEEKMFFSENEMDNNARGSSPDSGNFDAPDLLDEESNGDDKLSVMKITEEMMAEEEELEKKRKLEEEEELKKAQDDLAKEENEKRLKRLAHLLHQSEFFSNYISEQMEEQKKRDNEKKANKTNEKASTSGRKTKKATKKLMEDKALLDNMEKEIDVNEEKEDSKGEYMQETKVTPMGIEVDARQPFLLEGACMRDYQIDGFEWLKLLYVNGINGILADEMGLGKTIQTIALICYMIENKLKGPFLIVGPLSTLTNWVSEFNTFCPKVPCLMYHGTQDERRVLSKQISKYHTVQCEKFEVKTLPVVVTSYEVAMRDRDALQRRTWEIVAVDEGHRIKNHQCRLGKELRMYNSKCRILLTGTPLQNDLRELWSLLNYLIPDVFAELSAFESWFVIKDMSNESSNCALSNKKIVEREQKDHIISKMHKILRPFMLRRMKADIDLSLPPKKELLVFTPMTPLQNELYKHILNKTIHDKLNEEKEKREKEEAARRMLEYEKGGCVAKRLRRSLAPIEYNMDKLTEKEFEAQYNANLHSHTFKRTEAQSSFKKHCIEQGLITCLNPGRPMVDLRKVVNHPYLIQMPLVPGSAEPLIDEDIVQRAGKMLVLDAMLAKLKERGHKVLIFSQWRMVLDLIEEFMLLRGYNFCRLDGSTKIVDRAESISQFNKDPKIFAFLLSTRAGGLGINLTAADTVIIYDSDWNPQCDLQAQDRCHRIGQTKPVVVYRLTTDGTIDRRMVERATGKRRLEKLIIKQGHFVGHKSNMTKLDTAGELSPEELLKLLNSKDYSREFQANGYVYSDAELDQLLDRSDMYPDSAAKPKKSLKRKHSDADAKKIFEVL